MPIVSPTALRDFLGERGVTVRAAAVLAGVNASTISRICSGELRAQPVTIVTLAKALGVSATRMKAMTDAAWSSAHSDEQVPA
jgi:plasmid maintenance system antidote protein VapI